MWEFIISGYVPGTDFQFTFAMWLNVLGIILAMGLFTKLAINTDYSVDVYAEKLKALKLPSISLPKPAETWSTLTNYDLKSRFSRSD